MENHRFEQARKALDALESAGFWARISGKNARLAKRYLKNEVSELHQQAIIDRLTVGVDQAWKAWQETNAVREEWLLPQEDELREHLPRDLGRLADMQRSRRSEGGFLSGLLRGTIAAAYPFAPISVIREPDRQLLQELQDLSDVEWHTLGEDIRAAIKRYTVRPGELSEDPIASQELRDFLLGSKLDRPRVAYRIESCIGDRRADILAAKPGKVLDWPRAMSTRMIPEPLASLCIGADDLNDQEFANGNIETATRIMFELFVTAGFYIGHHSGVASGNEQELLIPEGSRWLVVGQADLLCRERTNLVRRHMVQMVQMPSI